LRGYVAEFEKKHRRRRRAAHYVVLPVARHGVRAFVISEFGGLAQLVPEHAAVSRAYGYGEYDSIDDWRAAVRSVLASAAALESRGLAGYVYTQVSDVEEELNGLLTYDRRVNKFAE
ncbi:MAG: glycoside hydrolase family 2, partial [Bifidobacterium adolescentis]